MVTRKTAPATSGKDAMIDKQLKETHLKFMEEVGETAASKEKNILEEAAEAVYGTREENYGSKSKNFCNVADLWTVLLREKLVEPITAQEVAMCMMQVKLARLVNTGGRHHDSIVDIAGYAECLSAINKEELKNNQNSQ